MSINIPATKILYTFLLSYGDLTDLWSLQVADGFLVIHMTGTERLPLTRSAFWIISNSRST